MTIEREMDPEATVKLPRPLVPRLDETLEDVDPDQTLVRENWEAKVIRRVAPRLAALQDVVAEDPEGEGRFGWESVGLQRLSRELRRSNS